MGGTGETSFCPRTGQTPPSQALPSPFASGLQSSLLDRRGAQSNQADETQPWLPKRTCWVSGAQPTFPLPCTLALLHHLPMEPEAEEQAPHRNSPVPSPLPEHLSTCLKARHPLPPESSPPKSLQSSLKTKHVVPPEGSLPDPCRAAEPGPEPQSTIQQSHWVGWASPGWSDQLPVGWILARLQPCLGGGRA